MPRSKSNWGRTKKRGALTRICAILFDRKDHLFSYFYDWVVETIEPTVAVREYKRDTKDCSCSLEEIVAEGRRKLLLSVLRGATSKGYLDIIYPEAAPSPNPKGHSKIDPKKCILRLTDIGFEHILNGRGTFSSLMAEIYSGLQAKRIAIDVRYLGKPELNEGEDGEAK